MKTTCSRCADDVAEAFLVLRETKHRRDSRVREAPAFGCARFTIHPLLEKCVKKVNRPNENDISLRFMFKCQGEGNKNNIRHQWSLTMVDSLRVGMITYKTNLVFVGKVIKE